MAYKDIKILCDNYVFLAFSYFCTPLLRSSQFASCLLPTVNIVFLLFLPMKGNPFQKLTRLEPERWQSCLLRSHPVQYNTSQYVEHDFTAGRGREHRRQHLLVMLGVVRSATESCFSSADLVWSFLTTHKQNISEVG